MPEHVQTIVIGAGVVGLAIARALALSGREVLVLERESAFGTITSARNSEVIHAGIYYPEGQPEGAALRRRPAHALRLLRRARHPAPALRQADRRLLAGRGRGQFARHRPARLRQRRRRHLREIPAAEAQAMEPALACHGALHSPSTGIVDSHALMLTLLGEAEHAGAMLVMHTDVIGLEALAAGSATEADGSEPPSPRDGFLVRTGGPEPMELLARELVNSAGLGAPAWRSPCAACPTRRCRGSGSPRATISRSRAARPSRG